MFMTPEEKGYDCPAKDGPCLATECPYYKTKCIIYSVKGKAKAKEWLRNQEKISGILGGNMNWFQKFKGLHPEIKVDELSFKQGFMAANRLAMKKFYRAGLVDEHYEKMEKVEITDEDEREICNPVYLN